MDIDEKNEERLTFTQQRWHSRRPHWGSNADVVSFETQISANIREYMIDLKNNKLLLIHGDVDGSDLVQVLDMSKTDSKLKVEAVGHIKDNRRGYHTLPSPDNKYSLRIYERRQQTKAWA